MGFGEIDQMMHFSDALMSVRLDVLGKIEISHDRSSNGTCPGHFDVVATYASIEIIKCERFWVQPANVT
jgi:hypothetical protein